MTRNRNFLVLLSLLFLSAFTYAGSYQQTNLVSDIPGLAAFTDPNLVNSWGVAFSPTGPFWVADNGAGVATVYYGNGRPFPKPSTPLVVTVPPPTASTGTSAPTGLVFNGTSDFVVTKNGASGPGRFLFDTEDGTISGWNPGVDRTHAVIAVDNSAPGGADGSAFGAVYKGLALARNGSSNFIYAANFSDGVVEMYDANFNFVKSFTDPSITPDAATPGFAPFGIRHIGGQLFVTFAMQDADRHDDVAGAGVGFVDIFSADGDFVRRFATGGTLNSPWGLALAPANFGRFSNALLVGNFGDGRINAFAPTSGSFLGQLQNNQGQPISIDGLWTLTFGNGGLAGATNSLFFSAGINDEGDGLFGRIRAVP